jgi:hypothetical protein
VVPNRKIGFATAWNGIEIEKAETNRKLYPQGCYMNEKNLFKLHTPVPQVFYKRLTGEPHNKVAYSILHSLRKHSPIILFKTTLCR